MSLQNKLLAKKRCYELAMQAALQKWQRQPVELICPACGYDRISTRPKLRGKHPRWCPNCKHHFDQPTHFVCDCPEPGSQSKCHDCPNFHKLLATIKAMAETLQAENAQQNQADKDL